MPRKLWQLLTLFSVFLNWGLRGFLRLGKGFTLASRYQPLLCALLGWFSSSFRFGHQPPTLEAHNFYLPPNLPPPKYDAVPQAPPHKSNTELTNSPQHRPPNPGTPSYCPVRYTDFTKLHLLSVLPSNSLPLQSTYPAPRWPQHVLSEYSAHWFAWLPSPQAILLHDISGSF